MLKSLGILTCLSSVCNAACEADGNLCADERCDVSANWPELLVVYGKDLPVSALMEQAGDTVSSEAGTDCQNCIQNNVHTRPGKTTQQYYSSLLTTVQTRFIALPMKKSGSCFCHLTAGSSVPPHVYSPVSGEVCLAASCRAEQKPRQEVITAKELMVIENV